jgi:hypothetical protein
MSMHPARLDDETGLTPRQMAKAQRAATSTALEVFRYGLDARAQAECSQHDTLALADASRTALTEEMDLLDYGLARAGGSAAKAELVARAVQRMAAIDDRQLTRRFGR